MDKSKLPTSHIITLDKIKGDSPLIRTINSRLESTEIKRMKKFSSLLKSFHLKNTVTTDVDGRRVVIEGKEVVNFSSANYLGLDQHPKIIEAATDGINRLGNHSGCSRIFSSHENIIRLEEETSKLVGSESTMICANVSHTHTGVIPPLFSNENSEIFIDRYAHTSLYQASLIAVAKGATLTRVDISKIDQTRYKILSSEKSNKVLLIDGVYSMQGNIPDIPALQEICDQNNCILYIDDAHGLGIYGENGGGVVEHFNLNFENMILVGSYQKGLGAFGAFVSGPSSLIDFLRVTSKSYMFSGTLQPQSVEGALAAIEISKADEGRELRSLLHAKSKYIRNELASIGYKVISQFGDSPIISVEIGDDLKTVMAGRKIFDCGVYLNSVMFPAVPRNQGILRISLNSIHTAEEIEILIDAFKELAKDLKKDTSKIKAPLKSLYQIAKSHVQGDSYRGL
jgi:7-keto-8-aminopelargonate synthetase-like enzyme